MKTSVNIDKSQIMEKEDFQIMEFEAFPNIVSIQLCFLCF